MCFLLTQKTVTSMTVIITTPPDTLTAIIMFVSGLSSTMGPEALSSSLSEIDILGHLVIQELTTCKYRIIIKGFQNSSASNNVIKSMLRKC